MIQAVITRRLRVIRLGFVLFGTIGIAMDRFPYLLSAQPLIDGNTVMLGMQDQFGSAHLGYRLAACKNRLRQFLTFSMRCAYGAHFVAWSPGQAS